MRRAILLTAALALLGALVGVAFAGSRGTLAEGTKIGGIDVGGLTAREATRVLAGRAESVERSPVTFSAGGKPYRLSASQLGVAADWSSAVRAASARTDGFAPLRGLRRLHTRLFGTDRAPLLTVYPGPLDYKLDQIAAAVDVPSVDAKLARKGVSISVVPGRSGRKLDRAGAAETIVRALGSFDRGGRVALPVGVAPPRTSPADLAPAARRARIALSAPIHLVYGGARWLLPRRSIAPLLSLPAGGERRLAVAGRGAEAYLERLSRTIDRRPEDAQFRVTGTGKLAIVPSRSGLQLDIPATTEALSAAAFSPTRRTASLVVRVAEPQRTTEEARRMGITGVVASYTTTYGGTPGRLHNVQLVSELIDGTLVAPGATFSFNETTGERSAEKGFQQAPVIINGEVRNGLGGGVCQVSTTVFNAAYAAGLPIGRRTNHALYVSHYPLGRDATVNYPDLDLAFSNDTGQWLLLRTFVGSGSLTVNLYGTPVDRRVESVTAPLSVTGEIPVKEIEDPTLAKGRRVIEERGAPPRETSVRRTVYSADGTQLYDDVWRSYYVGEPALVRVGTKPSVKKPATKGLQGRVYPVPGGLAAPVTTLPVTPR